MCLAQHTLGQVRTALPLSGRALDRHKPGNYIRPVMEAAHLSRGTVNRAP